MNAQTAAVRAGVLLARACYALVLQVGMWQVNDIEANCRIPHEAAECRRHDELSAMTVTLSAFLAALDSFVFLLLPSGAASLSTLSDCILER